MLFTFEERLSDSPFVERIWHAHSMRAGFFTSVAVSNWEMVVTRSHGKATMTVRGPETKATPLVDSKAGAEYFGIIFRLGTVMPYLPACTLVDGDVNLPEASSKSFWLNGSAWQIERARHATMLLQKGNSIINTVHEAGFADQAHLTRSLKRFIGQTPGQIIRGGESLPVSFLFKTTPWR